MILLVLGFIKLLYYAKFSRRVLSHMETQIITLICVQGESRAGQYLWWSVGSFRNPFSTMCSGDPTHTLPRAQQKAPSYAWPLC